MIRMREKSSTLKNVASSEKDMECFEDGVNRLVLFALISNPDGNLSEIYKKDKNRKKVDQVFGTMNGDLKSSNAHIRYCEKVKELFFIVLLTLTIRFMFREMLKDKSLLERKCLNTIII